MQAAVVSHFPPDDSLQITGHLVIALPVLHMIHQVLHHHHDPVVGAAVLGPFQRTDGPGDSGVDIRTR